MTRADVVARLRSLEPDLRTFGVASLYLFGSHARDEAGPDSDIDVLADFAQGQEPNFTRFMGAYHELGERLPRHRDQLQHARRTGATLPVFHRGRRSARLLMVSAKSPRIRLRHMLENIDGVSEVTAGLPIEAITGSFLLTRATEHALQIISEAAKELPDELRATEPDVPWRNIIGIGNLLRHEYYRIDPGVLAAILEHELPGLRSAVLRMIERTEG